MKVIIDNQATSRSVASGEIQAFIATLNNELKAQGKLIERFECNGRIVNFFMASQNPATLSGAEELKIFTKQIADVIKDTIDYSKVQLPKFIESLQKISELARQDKFSDALKAYITVLPFFRLLIMGLISVSGWSAKFSFDTALLDKAVLEINDALSRNDCVSFCDTLEYRVIPELRGLEMKLSGL